jgi:hypothetical protein
MSRSTAVLVLFLASLLEAGGDALMRSALKGQYQLAGRLGLFAAGALVLFSYGWVVNAPSWDFGKLLRLYVVFLFRDRATSLLAGLRTASRPRHLVGWSR